MHRITTGHCGALWRVLDRASEFVDSFYASGCKPGWIMSSIYSVYPWPKQDGWSLTIVVLWVTSLGVRIFVPKSSALYEKNILQSGSAHGLKTGSFDLCLSVKGCMFSEWGSNQNGI